MKKKKNHDDAKASCQPSLNQDFAGDLVTVRLCPFPFHSWLYTQRMCDNPSKAARHAPMACRFGIRVHTLLKCGSPYAQHR